MNTLVTTTTSRTLRRLRRASLAGVALVLVASTVLLYGASHTADTIAGQAELAVTEVAAARQAIVEADGAALKAFVGNNDPLGGPGDTFLGEITLAGQNLELAAGVNEGGADSSQTLQLVTSMISTYTSMIDSVSSAYAGGHVTLGQVEMWDASNFAHQDGAGILYELDQLDSSEATGLHALDSTFWTSPFTVPIWAIPAIALLVLLAGTQFYLARRFRRVINAPLAAATLLVLAALVAGPTLALGADRDLATSVTELDTVRANLRAQASTADSPNQVELAGMTFGLCGNGCGRAPDALANSAASAASANSTGGSAATMSASATTNLANEAAGRQTDAATTDLGLAIGLGAAGIAVAVLVLIGLSPRISEYRYRP